MLSSPHFCAVDGRAREVKLPRSESVTPESMRPIISLPARLRASVASSCPGRIRPRGCFRARLALIGLLGLGLAGAAPRARAEAMLQLFNVNWDELIQKLPEIAEAGYT